MDMLARHIYYTMLHIVGRICRYAFGGLLICIGLSGFIIPIIPGVPMIVLGLLIISPKSRLARRLMAMCTRVKVRLLAMAGIRAACAQPGAAKPDAPVAAKA